MNDEGRWTRRRWFARKSVQQIANALRTRFELGVLCDVVKRWATAGENEEEVDDGPSISDVRTPKPYLARPGDSGPAGPPALSLGWSWRYLATKLKSKDTYSLPHLFHHRDFERHSGLA